MMIDNQKALECVENIVNNCYAPYSGCRTAAVLEDTQGNLWTGVNVENISYGLTICAERAAVFSAVCAGVREFRKLLVYSPNSNAIPCGACRQVLSEFCSENFPVVVASPEMEFAEYSLGELLKYPFGG